MTVPHAQPPNPSSFDAWFDALTGRATSAPAGQLASHRQGALMRHLIQQRAMATAMQEAPADEAALQRHWAALGARAASAGALPGPTSRSEDLPGRPPHVEPATVPLARAANQRWFALAAGVATLAVGVSVYLKTLRPEAGEDNGEVVMRGGEVPVRLPVVPGMTAAERVRQITDVLDKHRVVHHEIGLTQGVQIQAKVPADSPARLDLNGLHIVVPAHGRLNLLIEQR